MLKHLPLLVGALVAVSACQPTVSGSVSVGATSPVFSSGSPPPPGRTDAERQARRDYYRGPRGDEF